jgi:predicted acyl esterase
VWSPRETQDLYQCIAWAGTQRWSSGKVGINGISYYAMNQWQVAALRPPDLAALCISEGASDYYREVCRHGGILCDFLSSCIRARSLDYRENAPATQLWRGRSRPGRRRQPMAIIISSKRLWFLLPSDTGLTQVESFGKHQPCRGSPTTPKE